MYRMALDFLQAQIDMRGKDIQFTTLIGSNNLSDAYILSAISHLVASTNVRDGDRLIYSMKSMIQRMDIHNGATGHYLNNQLMEALRADSARHVEAIARNGFAAWEERNKFFLSLAADMVTGIAYAAIAQNSALRWQINQRPHNLDNFIDNPRQLSNTTPEQLHRHFQNNGHNPRPLGDGSLAGKPFSAGGGFRVHWGGDRILQYHPAGGRHHSGVAYYKLSSGTTGVRRFDLNGNPLP